MTEEHWIKFYGAGDFMTESDLAEVRRYLAEFDHNQSEYTLNEVVQLHNIFKYLKMVDTNVDENEKAVQGTARKIIGRYFAARGLDNLNEEYALLYRPYREDFWEIFVDYQVIKQTSAVQLETFAKVNDVYIGSFLAQKAICEKYKVMLKTMLLREPRHFELFLKKFDSADKVSYEFPVGFTNAEISEWARRYCELPDANTNYLQQLALWSKQHEYKIEDKILVKAKRAYDSIISSYSVEGKGVSWGININIKPNVPEGVAFKKIKDSIIQIDYDQDWFDNERDYPTLLQNFIYVFDYLDKYGRFTFIGSPNKLDSFLDHFKTESKYAYKETLDFNVRRNLCRLSFLAYFDYLAHLGIDIEGLFSYCFNELFVDVFNIDQFFFHTSPMENSYYTRSKALLPEMDSILKQFDMYQQDGEIDLDLFELKSTSNGYRSIKSLAERKFVYLDSEEIKGITHLIFGSQTQLSFPEKKAEQKSFYKHVGDGVTLNDFTAGQQRLISETLEAKGFIGYDVANRIYFKNMLLVNVYGIIHASGYCSLLDFVDEILQLVDDEVKKGNLRYGNTLFSEQESDYISYIMDDKKYSNTLAIRNKITHGSYAKKSSKEHKNFYLELLMICMMYTIRINDELNYQDLKQNPDKTDETPLKMSV